MGKEKGIGIKVKSLREKSKLTLEECARLINTRRFDWESITVSVEQLKELENEDKIEEGLGIKVYNYILYTNVLNVYDDIIYKEFKIMEYINGDISNTGIKHTGYDLRNEYKVLVGEILMGMTYTFCEDDILKDFKKIERELENREQNIEMNKTLGEEELEETLKVFQKLYGAMEYRKEK